jgi:hypothetical protein
MRLLVFGYPAWFVFSIISLVPGIALVNRFALRPWWALPWSAVLVQLLLGAITHWPPSRWWPMVIIGGLPVPSGYVFGIALEAWHGYFYSLWPHAFIALIAALSLLVVQHFLPPQFHGSPRARRAGIISLATIVAIYLAAISISWTDQLESRRHIALFVLLWLLGLTALALLARAWRQARRNTTTSTNTPF